MFTFLKHKTEVYRLSTMKIFKIGLCILFSVLLSSCGEEKSTDQKPEQIKLTTADSLNKAYQEPETHKIPSVPNPSDSPKSKVETLSVTVSKEYLLGKFQFETHPDFIKVKLSTHLSRNAP